MNKLYGLVICGGQSSRMGTDKSLLSYHGLPQRYFLYEMLENFCDKVLISCNEGQEAGMDSGYNIIVDEKKYSGIGPMAGLLSAFENFPDTSFLVIGCDYPFITSEEIEKLIEARTGTKDAVCFHNFETGIHEPLVAIYENKCFPMLLKSFEAYDYSLRDFLSNLTSCKVIPSLSENFTSIDDFESFMKAKESLHANLN